jgi:hypothetical protein
MNIRPDRPRRMVRTLTFGSRCSCCAPPSASSASPAPITFSTLTASITLPIRAVAIVAASKRAARRSGSSTIRLTAPDAAADKNVLPPPAGISIDVSVLAVLVVV